MTRDGISVRAVYDLGKEVGTGLGNMGSLLPRGEDHSVLSFPRSPLPAPAGTRAPDTPGRPRISHALYRGVLTLSEVHITNEKKTARRNAYIVLLGGKCVRCGSIEDLEFDHVDPSTKTVRYIWSLSKARLDAEMSLLQLLCVPCHIQKTKAEFDQYHRPRLNPVSQYKALSVIHGTHRGRYQYNCRCEPCHVAYNTYDRALRTGDTEYVQAAKQRLRKLRLGMPGEELPPPKSVPRPTGRKKTLDF